MSARTGVVLLIATAIAMPAPAGAAIKRPRPTDVPAAQVATAIAPNPFQIYNDFATPARTFFSARAVVHFVTAGIDAPPLNDDDNGVPDYVERVGMAADAAIGYFERRGFTSIRPDSGGPDGRPDIYVSRFTPGTFGVAFPAARAEGGAFVVVSNALDPSPEQSLASVYGTVAHELFHLVQFSYFPAAAEPDLPPWVLEGTAAGMEARVEPALDDIVTSLQLVSWFRAPQRSITRQSYGAQLFWRRLDERYPAVIPAVLRGFAARQPSGAGGRLVAETFARATGRPLASAFHEFAVAVAADYADRLTPIRGLAPGARYRAAVAPLAIHYVRLRRATCTVTLSFSGPRRQAAATLAYRWESDVAGGPAMPRRLHARVSAGGGRLTFSVPASLARSRRFDHPLLIVTNGGAAARARYSVAAAR